MKILKKVLLVIGCLIALLLIIALFVKKEYTVERQVSIAKPKAQVFDYVKLTKNQQRYNKWVMKDPNMTMTYKGTDGTVGFVSAWDSKNSEVGKGEQQITELQEGEKIGLSLHFVKPFDSKASAWMKTEAASESSTNLKWGMQGHSPYPLNLMNLFVPAMLGKDMDESLQNLKAILEKQ